MHEVEIEGKNYQVPKAVFDLILSISLERDQYKNALEEISVPG